MQNDDAVGTLNHLISVAKDGVKGMQSAAENAHDPTLKTTLQRLSSERDHVASELQGAVRSLGGEPDDSGTTMGSAHRWFMNAKDAITGYDDKQLLEECERGEDFAVREFRQAISQSLPGDVSQQLQSCFGQVQKSHDEIKRLRNTARTS
jgi:uncharacterized protein (TIGR02284 family)